MSNRQHKKKHYAKAFITPYCGLQIPPRSRSVCSLVKKKTSFGLGLGETQRSMGREALGTLLRVQD